MLLLGCRLIHKVLQVRQVRQWMRLRECTKRCRRTCDEPMQRQRGKLQHPSTSCRQPAADNLLSKCKQPEHVNKPAHLSKKG